jgi:hypothetical protein
MCRFRLRGWCNRQHYWFWSSHWGFESSPPSFSECPNAQVTDLGVVAYTLAGVPLFLVERNFAEDLELGADDVLGIEAVNDDVGVRWVYSFLSADKRKTYCLYEAPSAEAIRQAAKRNDIPADVIVPVGEIRPEEIVAAEQN